MSASDQFFSWRTEMQRIWISGGFKKEINWRSVSVPPIHVMSSISDKDSAIEKFNDIEISWVMKQLDKVGIEVIESKGIFRCF